jgi:hypothetical protein
LGGATVREDRSELVPPDPGQDHRFRQGGALAQAGRHLPKHPVAARVAEPVVDVFETVDIQYDDAAPPSRTPGDHLEGGLKGTAVRESRQHVGAGRPDQLLLSPPALGQIRHRDHDTPDRSHRRQVHAA